eukprot:CAMPEP_0197833114 /NCGR_PEP_ID=MMETSP1437-20131217/17796_1 /TAXON_ID=49252 ORGANISM="Eucampia antarctica, Strain CCMP1452" /NCGR_SAMPLE_ID=MMETSP1437 /ASSEMBLY_ACC=CAM_ASM_001096 /LENGTH=905 /DNA_ID=CAMNT_0043436955 /DNA_START=312 /DNA_END=3029 /DNA_ORIENTATION=-
MAETEGMETALNTALDNFVDTDAIDRQVTESYGKSAEIEPQQQPINRNREDPEKTILAQAGGNAKDHTDIEDYQKRVTQGGVSKHVWKTPDGKAKYAYAFVVGGIHEDRPGYKGFIYNVLITVGIFLEMGSQADFVLWAQLSPDSTLQGKLPNEDERLLRGLGVEIRMLEREGSESFAQIVFEKFRILSMTEYRRVIFLDADIMPRINMDYLFELSDPDDNSDPILRPNLILATKGEPCNTAMFMAAPSEMAWQTFEDTVKRQHEEGKLLPYPHFNRATGWGWSFMDDGNKWEAIFESSWKWNYHASHSDQGLWLFLAKFAFQDVSIVIGDKLQNWIPGKNGKPKKILEDKFVPELERRSLLSVMPPRPKDTKFGCSNQKDEFKCRDIPYRDFVHFSGKAKPWQHGIGYGETRNWFEELKKLNKRFEMGLDVDNWKENHKELTGESPFGYLAMYRDHSVIIESEMSKLEKERVDNDAETDKSKPVTIAYAVSFIMCDNFQSNSAGLVDASLVMRHSIHKISVRNPDSGSKYDYKMYAIVHRQAEACSKALQAAGFEIMVVDNPVQTKEIRGDFLRRTIHREFCCGVDEFIKLYAYNKIPEEIFVHVDIDFAFYKPMDNLFDAMLYDKDSEEGKRARSLIERERVTDAWPDRIDAFITRDWHQVAPNKFPPGYQAGFAVGRRNPEAFNEIIEIIKEGNYTDGWGFSYGWGNKGYGGYVGAMAMQGLMGYYYDHIQPNASVELNQCRYNHMGTDVRYRKPPNFNRRIVSNVGKCRNANPEDVCEDCMVTEPDKIYSVHYTMCRKPWQCLSNGYSGGKIPGGPRASAVNTDTVHLDHCMGLVKKWHELRLDFEESLLALTSDSSIRDGMKGSYKQDIFLGHCNDEGNDGYLKLSASDEILRRSSELYN